MTPDRTMPSRVRQLLDAVDSFEKLQLLRLVAARRDEAWSLLRLAGELRLPSDEVDAPVQELTRAGLLARVDADHARYAPVSPDVDAAVAELIQLYQDDTLLVVRAITERAFEKIRDSAAHTFADAFVVRRSKPREPDDG